MFTIEETFTEFRPPDDALVGADTIWTDARCNDGTGHLTDLFFSDEIYDIARAKSICAKCPVQAACLSEAIAREEPWGVWGGELIENGKIRVKTRGRGRPPKVARAPLVIDELRQVPRSA